MKLVYFAHPYNGLRTNKVKASKIMAALQHTFPDITFVSPIHGLHTGMEYSDIDRNVAMGHCIELLKRCDELWTVDTWYESRGCATEVKYCKYNRIPIRIVHYIEH